MIGSAKESQLLGRGFLEVLFQNRRADGNFGFFDQRGLGAETELNGCVLLLFGFLHQVPDRFGVRGGSCGDIQGMAEFDDAWVGPRSGNQEVDFPRTQYQLGFTGSTDAGQVASIQGNEFAQGENLSDAGKVPVDFAQERFQEFRRRPAADSDVDLLLGKETIADPEGERFFPPQGSRALREPADGKESQPQGLGDHASRRFHGAV